MADPVGIDGHKKAVAKKLARSKCPMCGEPTVQQFRPFCSKRCAHLDLAKWLNEDYAIPVREEDLRDDERVDVDPGDA
ncbi:MAG TPA: DNA gyrase inhibitor YacG [Rhodospirillaceae bacterium]|nr:DNA gyrase inhibitor YacG [Alphaproteobacteria bacterium]OUT42118.1 MAG: hypothetical protein CBB62_07405 [Micavibrio sp. TMED2]HCI46668.1 DNA gyrase inhibitor YacG [Rhodospirillaceae bacterium]MAS46270.1 DNA gyrase inhibitor YacG [Alphaproteobacteria bacterium]MAX95544.1 DNA gyrase inhibitor YacG [Alphaproteobacteria bacterium]|tara:strand:- start:8148 stop:8381 length:234 start_codon:yes stop_codon:yes gene_type:complete